MATDPVWLQCYLAAFTGLVVRADSRDGPRFAAKRAARLADEAMSELNELEAMPREFAEQSEA